jgi:hypothetical protein
MLLLEKNIIYGTTLVRLSVFHFTGIMRFPNELVVDTCKGIDSDNEIQ